MARLIDRLLRVPQSNSRPKSFVLAIIQWFTLWACILILFAFAIRDIVKCIQVRFALSYIPSGPFYAILPPLVYLFCIGLCLFSTTKVWGKRRWIGFIPSTMIILISAAFTTIRSFWGPVSDIVCSSSQGQPDIFRSIQIELTGIYNNAYIKMYNTFPPHIQSIAPPSLIPDSGMWSDHSFTPFVHTWLITVETDTPQPSYSKIDYFSGVEQGYCSGFCTSVLYMRPSFALLNKLAEDPSIIEKENGVLKVLQNTYAYNRMVSQQFELLKTNPSKASSSPDVTSASPSSISSHGTDKNNNYLSSDPIFFDSAHSLEQPSNVSPPSFVAVDATSLDNNDNDKDTSTLPLSFSKVKMPKLDAKHQRDVLQPIGVSFVFETDENEPACHFYNQLSRMVEDARDAEECEVVNMPNGNRIVIGATLDFEKMIVANREAGYNDYLIELQNEFDASVNKMNENKKENGKKGSDSTESSDNVDPSTEEKTNEAVEVEIDEDDENNFVEGNKKIPISTSFVQINKRNSEELIIPVRSLPLIRAHPKSPALVTGGNTAAEPFKKVHSNRLLLLVRDAEQEPYMFPCVERVDDPTDSLVGPFHPVFLWIVLCVGSIYFAAQLCCFRRTGGVPKFSCKNHENDFKASVEKMRRELKNQHHLTYVEPLKGGQSALQSNSSYRQRLLDGDSSSKSAAAAVYKT